MITHWIWYLSDRKQERVQIQNILKELSQEKKPEVRTPRQTVFTREQNKLFTQRGLQYSQEEKGDELHYIVLGLN